MDDKRYDSLKIENIVASGAIADFIDLAEVAKKVDHCELNTKRFPGAVFRIEDPKSASLIFSSGKVVLTGNPRVQSKDGNVTSYRVLTSTDGGNFREATAGTWGADGRMKVATFSCCTIARQAITADCF